MLVSLSLQAGNMYKWDGLLYKQKTTEQKLIPMTDKLPEAWFRKMCWVFGMWGRGDKQNNQHKLQWTINRNMQRLWGGRSCSTPLPLDSWTTFSTSPFPPYFCATSVLSRSQYGGWLSFHWGLKRGTRTPILYAPPVIWVTSGPKQCHSERSSNGSRIIAGKECLIRNAVVE